MSGLARLYSEVIKKHASTPFHFGKKAGIEPAMKAYNPICGDRFEIFVDHDVVQILDLHFDGFGCAISKASTSVMLQSLAGKSLREAKDICTHFLLSLETSSGESGVNLPAEFLAFGAVRDYPERMDCATLAWKEMKKYLESLT